MYLDCRISSLCLVLILWNISDGVTAAGPNCGADKFQCKSGVCINSTSVCDHVFDCDDGGDEKECDETCPDDWFHCLNGECILLRWLCDGETDCSDHSDELNCGQIISPCTSDEFRCHDNSKCLPLGWVCDGTIDCKDHSDEAPLCTKQEPCTHFQCRKSRECVPSRWRCDGSIDCEDASDEFNCTDAAEVCLGFYCVDRSHCLDRTLVCNGIKNCDDGSDEGGQCDEHTCSKVKCSHGCFQTPALASCYCPTGYELPTYDHNTCHDVNECTDQGSCSQHCVNTIGSYVCSCMEGYSLQDDHTTCKLKDPEPILIYSAIRELKVVKLRIGLAYTKHTELNHAVGVDYDNRKDRLYWTEIEGGSEAIKSSKMDGSDIRSMVTNGISVVEDVAFDWIGSNIYFTDSGHQQLVVCDSSGVNCRVLFHDLRQPRALVVYPSGGFVFWSDWSHSPAIERAGMDGTLRRPLVTANLGWPNGLTIDYPLGCLYWVDAKMRHVESVKLDGSDRRVILEDMMLHPFSLAVLEDTFYWTDWSRHTLESCNKFTGADHKILLKETRENIPMGLHAYHPVVRPMTNNPCWTNECAQLCLLSPDGAHRCACREGHNLLADEKSCHGGNSTKRVFLASKDTVHEFEEAKLGRNNLVTLFKAKQHISAIAYDSLSNRFVYNDMGSNELVSVDLNTKKQTVLLAGHLENVHGMAIDWISGNIYWTDSSRRSLEVSRGDGKHRRVLADKFSAHPMDIVLLPSKGFLFMALIGTNARIEQVDLDGTDRHIFVDYEVNVPLSLVIDHAKERLYWVDSGSNKIEWASLDGKHRYAMKSDGGHPVSVSVTADHIWWTDVGRDLLMWMGKETGSAVSSIKLQLDGPEKVGNKLLTMDLDHLVAERGREGCAVSNGKCSHLCLPNKLGFVCACPTGMELSSDHTTCQVEAKCNSLEFTCGDGECITLDFTCDSVKDCKDGSDETNCERPCTAEEFQCGNRVCIPIAWKCDHRKDCEDNLDELDCNRTVTCPAGMFTCKSGECIHVSWKCDSVNDCSDASDEIDCLVKCAAGDFHCKSGQCIPGSWKCDGETDCRDASDEDDTCITQLKSCTDHEMTCDNGRCIEKDLVCDNDDDCGDGSDERKCEKPASCPSDTFHCTSTKKCVPTKSVCDGVHDCANGEDEVDCTEPGCKSPREFLCPGSKICIESSWLCDGENDCSDQADEKLPQCHLVSSSSSKSAVMSKTERPYYMDILEEHHHANPSTHESTSVMDIADVSCKHNEFTCNFGGHCIPLSSLCDHRPDCPDNSDEGSFCATSCDIDNGGCSDVCYPTPSGAKCWCRAGFELLDEKSCHDIDECGLVGACSHLCHNVPGTYACSCASGYHLRSDHRSCKAQGPVPYLLVAFPTKILSYTLGGNHVQVIVQDNSTKILDVDFDAATGDIYWIDTNAGTLWKYCESKKTRVQILEHLESPSVLAFDWLSQLLVLSESTGHISVCTLDGVSCSSIYNAGLSQVASMALDPRKGIIYWSIWSDGVQMNGAIESVSMNGKRPRQIVSDKMVWPCGLTIDFIHDVLYWVDAHLHAIESIDLNTKKRRVVSRKDLAYPMSLTLFEDRLYFPDWSKSAILDCDRWTCMARAVLLEHVTIVHKLAILHPVQQPNGSSRCTASSQCSHICVTVRNGYACLCPNGMHFTDKRNTTCAGVATSRSAKLDICTSDTCLNGGECEFVHDHAHCICRHPFVGHRCEFSGRSTVEIVEDDDDDDRNSSWLLWLIGIALLVALVAFSGWYFLPVLPYNAFERLIRTFRGAFAPVPLNNPAFDEDGNPIDEQDQTNANSCRNYSNPLFETCHGGNLTYNGKDGKVEFHVSASSVSLDSAFNSETISGANSRSTLVDLSLKDKLLP